MKKVELKEGNAVRILKENSISACRVGDVGVISAITGNLANVSINGERVFGNWFDVEDLEFVSETYEITENNDNSMTDEDKKRIRKTLDGIDAILSKRYE